jgi:hypothetical protein
MTRLRSLRAGREWTFAGLIALALLSAAPAARGAKPKPQPPRKPPPTTTATPAATTPGAPDTPSPPSAPVVSGSTEVTVIEVAGARAYVQPGANAGIHRGATVALRGKEYPVIETSDSFAVIQVGSDAVREQERGKATLVSDESHKPVELPKPRDPAIWEHAWSPEQPPADAQQPRFVPLGGDERNRRFDVRLTLAAGGLIPFGSQVGNAFGQGELNARLHAEPFAVPLALDVDASLYGWAAADLATRVGGPTRPTGYVRELLASYSAGGLYAGIGRMRYAASTLGTLDGARVQKELGGSGFSIGAFGGLLPNPLSSAPSLDAQRFGVEARFHRPDIGVRPEAALVVHGSTFQGALDERRLSGTVSVYPGPSRIGGYFEVSNFDANNPWRAAPVELTAAGVDASVRLGNFEFGGRFDAREPELSRWLGSFFPQSWFCTTIPAPAANPTAPEPCDGTLSRRMYGQVDARVEIDRFSLSLGGTTVRDLNQSGAPDMTGGFAALRAVRLVRTLRLEASGNYSHSTYFDLFGGTAGPGVTLLGDALDLTAYYRISVIKYRSVDTSLTQNGAGATLAFFPNAAVFFTFQGEAIAGDDVNALMLFATLTWRPRL